MIFRDILAKDDFLPTTVAVNLIVYLNIFQNGYDITEEISDIIERCSKNLHEKIKSDWGLWLKVKAPDGKRRISISDYLGDDFTPDDSAQVYKFSEVKFKELVNLYNNFMELSGQPRISLEGYVEERKPAVEVDSKLLSDLTGAVAEFASNIATRDKVTTDQFYTILKDDLSSTLHHKPIGAAQQAIYQAIHDKLQDCITPGRPKNTLRDQMLEAAFYLSSKYKDASDLSKLPSKDKLAIEIGELNRLSKPDRIIVAEKFLEYRNQTS